MAGDVKYALLGTLLLSLPGCGLLGVDSGSGGGASVSSASSGSSSGAAQGSSCGTDPTTGATLCLGNSLCPGVTVDSSVFPECGFLVSGSNIDVECVCGSYLCPLGSTATCAALTTLLAQSNEGAVCAQASAGQCVQLSGSGTASSSSSGSSSCDTTCRDECGEDPTCIEACGC